MSKYITLISIICDKKINEDLKLKTAQEINERLENIISTGDYNSFLENIVPNFLLLLQEEEVNFISESLEQQKRKTFYEIIYRLPLNESLKPYVKQILINYINLLSKENETNALIIIKGILELLKQFRPSHFNEINFFLGFFTSKIKELNGKRLTILDENVKNNLKILNIKHETLLPIMEHLYYSITIIPENTNNVSPNSINHHYTLLPKSNLSLKVLSELPIIVVIIYQLYKPNIHQEINSLIPHLIEYACMQQIPNLNKQACTGFHKEVFCEFITSQVKILSFIAYIVRPFQETLNQYANDLIKGIISLLKHCPSEMANIRKEILIALRHIQATHLRSKFIPYLEEFLDQKLLLGPNVTCADILCPLAYSSLADIVHHLRTNLNFSQLESALSVFSKNIEDDTLPFSIQNVSCKLLLNLVECLKVRAETENKPNGRAVIAKILKVFVLKFKSLSQYKIHSIYRDIIKLMADNPEYAKLIPLMTDEKGIEGTSTMFLSLPSPFTVAYNSLNEIKIIVKTLLTGVKTSTWGILTCKDGTNTCVNQSKLLFPQEIKYYKTFVEHCLNSIVLLYLPFTSTGILPPSNQSMPDKKLDLDKDIDLRATSNYGVSSSYSNLRRSRYEYVNENLPYLITFYNLMLLNNTTFIGCEDEVRSEYRQNISYTFDIYRANQMKEQQEHLDSLVGIFLMINQMSFYQIFSADHLMPKLFDLMIQDNNLLVIVTCFLSSSSSPPFLTTLLEYLMDNFADLGCGYDKVASVFLQSFKLVFKCSPIKSAENEAILKNHIGLVITKIIESSLTSNEPLNYFLLLKYLFQYITNGPNDSFTQEFLPLIPNILQSFNSYLSSDISKKYLISSTCSPDYINNIKYTSLQSSNLNNNDGVDNINRDIQQNSICYHLHDLIAQLCLTIPVRLSSLLPHLSLLMDPLLSALNVLSHFQGNTVFGNGKDTPITGSFGYKGSVNCFNAPNYINDLSWNLIGNQRITLLHQGLRTLEILVDSLNPEFLKENLDPVKPLIVKALWKLLSNTYPSNLASFNIHSSNQDANTSQSNQGLNTSLSSLFESVSSGSTTNNNSNNNISNSNNAAKLPFTGLGYSASVTSSNFLTSSNNTNNSLVTSSNSVIVETAFTQPVFRLLGKLGGANRQSFKEIQDLTQYETLNGRGSYVGFCSSPEVTSKRNIISIPVAPIIDMAYQLINMGNIDMSEFRNAWNVIYSYLCINISTEFEEENKLYHLFTDRSFASQVERKSDLNSTYYQSPMCYDLKARDTHRKALAALFMCTTIDGLRKDSTKMANDIVNHYTLLALSRQAGILSNLMTPTIWLSGNKTSSLQHPYKSYGMDANVLVDALVFDLMGHLNKELGKTALKFLITIIDTCTQVLRNDTHKVFQLPIITHLADNIISLCYSSGWYEKQGGCIGINFLLVKADQLFILRRGQEFLKAIFYVFMDLSHTLSHGTLTLAKTIFHNIIKYFANCIISTNTTTSMNEIRSDTSTIYLNIIIKEIILHVTSSAKVVRMESMYGLRLISQWTRTPLAQLLKPFSLIINDLLPPKKHLLRHQSVNSQYGLMDALIFLSGDYALFPSKDREYLKLSRLDCRSQTIKNNSIVVDSGDDGGKKLDVDDDDDDDDDVIDRPENCRISFLDVNVAEHCVFFGELVSLCEADDSILIRLPCYKNLTNLEDLRCLSLRALTSCHQIPQCREKIFPILFKHLNESTINIEYAAYECLSVYVKEHSVDMETVHHAIRNLLLMLGDYRNLTSNFMTRLLYYTKIFPNTFNEKFCEHLMTHLVTLLKVLSTKTGIKNNTQEIKICSEILKIFVSLPNASSNILTNLCAQLFALDSIYLDEIVIYLNQELYDLFAMYPKETTNIFILKEENLHQNIYFSFYMSLLNIKPPQPNLLIEYLVNNMEIITEIVSNQAKKLDDQDKCVESCLGIVDTKTNDDLMCIENGIINTENKQRNFGHNCILSNLHASLKVLRAIGQSYPTGKEVLGNSNDLITNFRTIWNSNSFQQIYEGNEAFYMDYWNVPNMIIHFLINYIQRFNTPNSFDVLFELSSCLTMKFIENVDELKVFINITLVQYPLKWKKELFLNFLQSVYVNPGFHEWSDLVKASILDKILYPLFENSFKTETNHENVFQIDSEMVNQFNLSVPSSFLHDTTERNLFRLFVDICIYSPQEIQNQKQAKTSSLNSSLSSTSTSSINLSSEDLMNLEDGTTNTSPSNTLKCSSTTTNIITPTTSTSIATTIKGANTQQSTTSCSQLKIALFRMSCLFIQYYNPLTDTTSTVGTSAPSLTISSPDGIPSPSLNLQIQTQSPTPASNSKKQNTLLRKLVTFAWPCLQTSLCIDPCVKYNGHLLLAYIVQKFNIHKKIVIQLFHSLLKASSTESRSIIKKALEVLIPAIPKRMDNGMTMLTYSTKKVLVEESHTLNQLAHLLHIILANKDIYYFARHSIIHLMLSAMTKLGFTGNNTSENKKLVVDVAEMIIEWEYKALKFSLPDSVIGGGGGKGGSGQVQSSNNITIKVDKEVVDDITSNIPSDSIYHKPFGPIVGENMINMLLRISCPVTESGPSTSSQSLVTEYLINKCHVLLVKACDLLPWRNVHLKFSWIDKIINSLEIFNAGSMQSPSTNNPSTPTSGGLHGQHGSNQMATSLSPHQLLQQKISVNALSSFLETLNTTKLLVKLTYTTPPLPLQAHVESIDATEQVDKFDDTILLPPLTKSNPTFDRISFRQVVRVLNWCLANTISSAASNPALCHYNSPSLHMTSAGNHDASESSPTNSSTYAGGSSSIFKNSQIARMARVLQTFLSTNLTPLLAPTMFTGTFITEQRLQITKHLPNLDNKSVSYSPWVSPVVLKLIQRNGTDNKIPVSRNEPALNNQQSSLNLPIYPEELEEFYKNLCSVIGDYLNSVERINMSQLGMLNHVLNIMKSCAINNLYFIDRYLGPFLKVFQKIVKEHISCSLNTSANVPPSSSIPGNFATGLDNETLIIQRDCITIALDLLKSRLNIMTNDMRKNFIGNILVGLIERSTDSKLLSFIIDLVWDWLKKPLTLTVNGNIYNNGGPSIREKSIILVKFIHCIEKRFSDNHPLKYKFLDLVLFVYNDPELGASELCTKLESAYLSGLRCPYVKLRHRFWHHFDSQINKTVYDRLYYISSCQNWETFGSYFWIKQCIQLLLMLCPSKEPLLNMSPTTNLPSISSLFQIGRKIAFNRSPTQTTWEDKGYLENLRTFLNDTPKQYHADKPNEVVDSHRNDFIDSVMEEESEKKNIFKKVSDEIETTPELSDSNVCVRQLISQEIEFIDHLRESLNIKQDEDYQNNTTVKADSENQLNHTSYPKIKIGQRFFVDNLIDMCQISTKLSEWLWINIIPQFWSTLGLQHKRSLYQEYQLFFLSGTHVLQRDSYPSVIGIFFQSFIQCKPKVYFHPNIIKYLARAHNLWHVSLDLLEDIYYLNTTSIRNTNLNMLNGKILELPSSDKTSICLEKDTLSVNYKDKNEFVLPPSTTANPINFKIPRKNLPPEDAFEFKCEVTVEQMLNLDRQPILSLNQSIFDCLSETYGYLGEFDFSYALWLSAKNIRTVEAFTQMLWNDHYSALVTFEDLMENANNFIQAYDKNAMSDNTLTSPPKLSHKVDNLKLDTSIDLAYYLTPEFNTEYKFWETNWVECQKELNQWDLLNKYATGYISDSSGSVGSHGKTFDPIIINPHITLDTAWKLSDWNSMKEGLTLIQKRCSRETAWKVNLCAGYLALSQSDEHHLSMIDKIVEITSGLCVREWKRLPTSVISSNVQGPLLRAAQKIIELQDAAQLHISIQSIQQINCNRKLNFGGYTGFQPGFDGADHLTNDQPGNANSYNSFNNNNTLAPSLDGVTSDNTNFNAMYSVIKAWNNRNLNLDDPYSFCHDIYTWRQQQFQYIINMFSEQQIGGSGGASGNQPDNNTLSYSMNALNTSNNNPLFKASHSWAQSLIRLGTIARKQRKPLVALEILNKVTMHPSTPIADCYRKVRQSIKCYLDMYYQNVVEGLEVTPSIPFDSSTCQQAYLVYPLKSVQTMLDETNLKYFTREMLSEIYCLKGYTSHLARDYEESNKSFSTSIQLNDSHLKAWGSWGECMAQRFWERITSNSQICKSVYPLSQDNPQHAPSEEESEKATLRAHPRFHYNFNLAKSALISFLQACRCSSESRVAKYVAQILWLLKYDDPNKYVMTEIVDKYLTSIPTHQWLNWIPQLLMALERSEDVSHGRYITNLITHVGRTFPQAIFFPVRTSFLSLKMELKDASYLQSGSIPSPSANSPNFGQPGTDVKTKFTIDNFSPESDQAITPLKTSPTMEDDELHSSAKLPLKDGDIFVSINSSSSNIFSDPALSTLSDNNLNQLENIVSTMVQEENSSNIIKFQPIVSFNSSTNEVIMEIDPVLTTNSTNPTLNNPIQSSMDIVTDVTDTVSNSHQEATSQELLNLGNEQPNMPPSIPNDVTLNGNANPNSNPNAVVIQNPIVAFNPYCSPIFYCRRVLHVLREFHPTTLYTLEGLVDQLIWFRETWFEELLQYLKQLRNKCYILVYQELKINLKKFAASLATNTITGQQRDLDHDDEEEKDTLNDVLLRELMSTPETYFGLEKEFVPYGECSGDMEIEPMLNYIASIMIKLLTTFETGIENLSNLAFKLSNSSTESSIKRAQATIKDPMFSKMKMEFLNDFGFVRDKPLELEDVEKCLLGKLKKWVQTLERKAQDDLPKNYYLDDKCALLNNWLQNDVEIELPGEVKHSKPSQYSVKICKFIPRIGIQHKCAFFACRRISVRGSDGKLYHYLVLNENLFLSPVHSHAMKPIEKRNSFHSRVVTQQLMRYLNKYLKRQHETLKRDISFKLPRTITISPHMTLVEIDESMVSLLDIYENVGDKPLDNFGQDDFLSKFYSLIKSPDFEFDYKPGESLKTQPTDIYMEIKSRLFTKLYDTITGKEIGNTVVNENGEIKDGSRFAKDNILKRWLSMAYPSHYTNGLDAWTFKKNFALDFGGRSAFEVVFSIFPSLPDQILVFPGKTWCHGPPFSSQIDFSHLIQNIIINIDDQIGNKPSPIQKQLIRLTPNLKKLFGPLTIEGPLTNSFKAVVRTLADPKMKLDNVLRALLSDIPSINVPITILQNELTSSNLPPSTSSLSNATTASTITTSKCTQDASNLENLNLVNGYGGINYSANNKNHVAYLADLNLVTYTETMNVLLTSISKIIKDLAPVDYKAEDRVEKDKVTKLIRLSSSKDSLTQINPLFLPWL